MIVYIEYIIIDNMIINFIILYLTSIIMRTRLSVIRLLIGAIVGTFFAFIIPILSINSLITLLIKLLIGLLICICSNKQIKLKVLMLFYLVFLFMTFAIGGLCLTVIYFLSGEISLISYELDFPVGILILIVSLYAICIKRALILLKKRSKITDYIYDVKLLQNGKEVKILAFFDSGNGLSDEKYNKPIVIINLATLIKIVDENQLNYLLVGKYESSGLKNIYKTHYTTISSNGDLIVFSIDNMFIKIKNEFKAIDAMVGVSLNNIIRFNNYDALVGPKALEVINV